MVKHQPFPVAYAIRYYWVHGSKSLVCVSSVSGICDDGAVRKSVRCSGLDGWLATFPLPKGPRKTFSVPVAVGVRIGNMSGSGAVRVIVNFGGGGINDDGGERPTDDDASAHSSSSSSMSPVLVEVRKCYQSLN